MLLRKRYYGGPDTYERKLEAVMKRFNIDEYNFNWDRWGCWVELTYNEKLYRFEHSIERAKEQGVELRTGADAFAQVVLTLEDLVRMVERGVYDLETWVAGMRYLPATKETPEYFRILGFAEMPAKPEMVRERYRSLVKQVEVAGDESGEQVERIRLATEAALRHLDNS